MGNLDYFNVSVTQSVVPEFCEPDTTLKRGKHKEKNIDKLAENFLNDKNDRNFNRLMERCKWGLRSYIFDMVNDDTATDDILSRTMEHIYYRCDSFKGGVSKFSTWMYKIAYNNTLKYLNGDSMYLNRLDDANGDMDEYYERSLFDDSAVDSDGDPYGYVDGFDIEMIFRTYSNCTVYTREKVMSDIYDASIECINRLPEKYRLVMTGRYIDNKNIKEVAKDNNMSALDVKNWIRRARDLVNNDIESNYTGLFKIYKQYTQE